MGTVGELLPNTVEPQRYFSETIKDPLENVRATFKEPWRNVQETVVELMRHHQASINLDSLGMICGTLEGHFVFRDLFSTMFTLVIPEFCLFVRTLSGCNSLGPTNGNFTLMLLISRLLVFLSVSCLEQKRKEKKKKTTTKEPRSSKFKCSHFSGFQIS